MNMKWTRSILAALAVSLMLGSYMALAQQAPAPPQPQGRGQQGPPPPMSFFVSSVGKGDGGTWGDWPAPTHTVKCLRPPRAAALPNGRRTSARRVQVL